MKFDKLTEAYLKVVNEDISNDEFDGIIFLADLGSQVSRLISESEDGIKYVSAQVDSSTRQVLPGVNHYNALVRADLVNS
jgi:hypothetical protein